MQLTMPVRSAIVIPIANIVPFQWLFVEEIFYFFVHWTIKQTFLSFYLRFSRDPVFHRHIRLATGLNAAVIIVNWLLSFLQCIPFDAIMHRAAHPDAKCINSLIIFLVPAILVRAPSSIGLASSDS